MRTKNNATAFCPRCHRLNTIVSVKDIGKGYPGFAIDAFCAAPRCTWAARKERTGAKAHAMINGGKFDRGKTLYIPEGSDSTLDDIGVEQGLRHSSRDAAFAGIIEHVTPEKRVPEILIPVYNVWNYAPASIHVSKNSITFPERDTALAGLLADAYENELMYITEKPIDALNIRLAAVECFHVNQAVLIPLKGKKPPLAPLVSAKKVICFVRNEEMRRYLKKELPDNTVYVKEGLICERGRLTLHLRSIVCG